MAPHSESDRDDVSTDAASTLMIDTIKTAKDVTDKDLESGVGIAILVHVEKVDTPSEFSSDSNIVDWDGPDDLSNPRNWSTTTKNFQLSLISVIMLMSDVTPAMFAPGSLLLLKEFDLNPDPWQSFIITIYLLGFAFGPLVLAPLSEMYGRRVVYRGCTAVFFVSVIGCSRSVNVVMFLFFLMIAGCAASGNLTIPGGTIEDLMKQDTRGRAMSFFAIGPLTGPIVGPVIGGFIAQRYGWRYIFYISAGLSSLMLSLTFFVMRETYHPLLLAQKASLLCKETGNPNLKTKYQLEVDSKASVWHSIIRPLRLLVFSPLVLAMSVYTALNMGLGVLLFTTFPTVFQHQYGFSPGQAGLTYMGFGIGMFIGLIIFTLLSDPILKRQARGGVMKPEFRLPLMIFTTWIVPVGFLWYGWSAEAHLHYMVTILGTSLIGVGSMVSMMPAMLYLIDAFGAYSASALAATSVLRSIFGTFLPLLGPKMYDVLGMGKGNTMLAILTGSLIPVPWLFYKYGETLRTRWPVKM